MHYINVGYFLTSTKLYMKITENSSQEQELAIEYKRVALDLFKIL